MQQAGSILFGLDDSVAYQKKLGEYWGKNLTTGAAKMEALNSAGISKLSLGIGAVTTAISLAGAAYNAYQSHLEDMRQSADEASQSFESTASDIDSYKQKISELKASLASGTLSQQEQYDAKSQLLSIQDDIIDKYGQEASALDILSASSDAYAESLDRITQKEAETNLRKNKEAYAEAAKEMEKQRTYKIGFGGIEKSDSAMQAIREVASKYSNLEIDYSSGLRSLNITGNANEAREALDALYSAMTKVSVSAGDLYSFNNFKDSISADLDDVENIISDFGDRYQEYLKQKVFSNDTSAEIANHIYEHSNIIDEVIASGDYDTASEKVVNLSNIDLSGIDDDSVRECLQNLIDEAYSDEYTANIKLNTQFAEGSNDKNL